MYHTLLHSLEDNVATITLNNPKAGNAFSLTAFRETAEIFDHYDNQENVRALILTGSGKNFSVGGDVNAMQADENYISYDTALLADDMSRAIRQCSKPVVAMINGAAAGAGLGLALACDFRIMTEKSSLITGFIDMGLCGDTTTLFHLYNIVGLAKATELMMLSTPVRGKEALALGLTTRLAPEDQLLTTTMELVEEIKKKPAAAITHQKKLIYDHFYKDFKAYCEIEAQLFHEGGRTKDHHDAVAAFLDKKKST